ncbi:hypothetical protein V8F33_012794 [Rhypophila sp. PSN 637]
MVLYGEGFQREPTAFERLMQLATNMSPNYHGDPGNIYNYSNVDLPDAENCSFWMERLPPDVTLTEILANIRHCGRIYAIHVNREQVPRFGHAGRKLAFFDRASAHRFWVQYVLHQGFFIRGYQAYIRRNRNKVAEQFGLQNTFSRCLVIAGPQNIVNTQYLFNLWKQKFIWDIDTVIHHPSPYFGKLEIRFGSYRAQASIAFKILTTCKVFLDADVWVEYARDPCDV